MFIHNLTYALCVILSVYQCNSHVAVNNKTGLGNYKYEFDNILNIAPILYIN